jgi:hypothetical protein
MGVVVEGETRRQREQTATVGCKTRVTKGCKAMARRVYLNDGEKQR